MNTMCDKVRRIVHNVIACSITKKHAMEVLKIKHKWLYPYITESVWNEHYALYLKYPRMIDASDDLALCDDTLLEEKTIEELEEEMKNWIKTKN